MDRGISGPNHSKVIQQNKQLQPFRRVLPIVLPEAYTAEQLAHGSGKPEDVAGGNPIWLQHEPQSR
jgi:hypothetical protein